MSILFLTLFFFAQDNHLQRYLYFDKWTDEIIFPTPFSAKSTVKTMSVATHVLINDFMIEKINCYRFQI